MEVAPRSDSTDDHQFGLIIAADAETVALLTYRRGGEDTGEFKSGTLYVIDGETGKTEWKYTFDPLKPYFEEVTFWRGVSGLT